MISLSCLVSSHFRAVDTEVSVRIVLTANVTVGRFLLNTMQLIFLTSI